MDKELPGSDQKDELIKTNVKEAEPVEKKEGDPKEGDLLAKMIEYTGHAQDFDNYINSLN